MTTAQIADQIMDPRTRNLGAVGVALVNAARKPPRSERPELACDHEIGNGYAADDFVLRAGRWYPADD